MSWLTLLSSVLLPGEALEVSIIQEGKSPGKGLATWTMAPWSWLKMGAST